MLFVHEVLSHFTNNIIRLNIKLENSGCYTKKVKLFNMPLWKNLNKSGGVLTKTMYFNYICQKKINNNNKKLCIESVKIKWNTNTFHV